jgi:hypothetical protein
MTINLKTLLSQLSGKKTYIVAAATILYCLIGINYHYMNVSTAATVIGTSGAIATLRIGVAK